jgi:predicted dinucleotide-utilizing enzyme
VASSDAIGQLVERLATDVATGKRLHMRKIDVACVVRAVGAALDPGLIESVKQLEEKNDQAARAISIGQLNALPRLHLRPINVVVFDGSSGDCSREAYS